MKERNLAAIDLGTNSFHIIIVKVKPDGTFESLGKEKESVRLGSGTGMGEVITPEAMARGLKCLKRFKGLADIQNADIRALATSALREAKNRESFLARVKDEIGINIEVISGFEEARLIYFGILQGLPVYDKKIMLVDIGGGSTEILVGQKGEILFAQSLKMGAIRLTDKFFTGDPTREADIEDCKLFVEGMISPYIREIEKLKPEIIIGSSGTIQSICQMIIYEKGEDSPRNLNTYVFKDEELYNIRELLNKADTLKKRTKLPGLDSKRADIIVAGSIILEEIFKIFSIREMTVSDYALREGIIFDTIQKEIFRERPNGLTSLDNIRFKAVKSLADSFPYEREHVNQVSRLALRVFDQLQELHNCTREEREYLEAACMLHEVGMGISHSSHHKHSYYIIRNSELMVGYNFEELEIIALTARYHRKSPPKPKHTEFAKLTGANQFLIKKLSSFLRIADGLDRSHKSIVEDVTCENQESVIVFKVKIKKGADPHIDVWSAGQKKDLFEATFDRKAAFVIV
jgi:exopolyphosphatase/guanosine-5'-triphosphate,3'-diphosphate pyrophosphatase